MFDCIIPYAFCQVVGHGIDALTSMWRMNYALASVSLFWREVMLR